MKSKWIFILLAVLFALPAFASDDEEPDRTRVIIYPVLFQAPIYGATVDLPEVPGNPPGGEADSRSTDYSWNSAILAGISIEQHKWFIDFEGEYAGLSSERSNPLLDVNTDIYYLNFTGGWKIYHDFSITGGVKRFVIDVDAKLGEDRTAHVKPSVWDPMIGVDWRSFVTRKLQLKASVEGGGFGVGTDVDVSGMIDFDYELLPHFILDAGYGFLYFKDTVADVSIGDFRRKFIVKQTLHGPRIGLGIRF